MPEVRCSVSNCSFWGQGNFCQASAIIVQPDADETGQTENESYTSAVLTNETLESSVATSVETCCHTFKQNIKHKSIRLIVCFFIPSKIMHNKKYKITRTAVPHNVIRRYILFSPSLALTNAQINPKNNIKSTYGT